MSAYKHNHLSFLYFFTSQSATKFASLCAQITRTSPGMADLKFSDFFNDWCNEPWTVLCRTNAITNHRWIRFNQGRYHWRWLARFEPSLTAKTTAIKGSSVLILNPLPARNFPSLFEATILIPASPEDLSHAASQLALIWKQNKKNRRVERERDIVVK